MTAKKRNNKRKEMCFPSSYCCTKGQINNAFRNHVDITFLMPFSKTKIMYKKSFK